MHRSELVTFGRQLFQVERLVVGNHPSDVKMLFHSLTPQPALLRPGLYLLALLNNGTRHHFNNGHAKDRREHFSAAGSHSSDNRITLEYSFRVIGSSAYYQSIDARAYDAKITEAVETLQSLKAK